MPSPLFSNWSLRSCFILLVLLLVATHFFALPKTLSITSTPVPIGVTERATLLPDYNPHIESVYRHRFLIRYHAMQQTRFQFYPSWCINSVSVGGERVEFNPRDRCNRMRGAMMDLTGKLTPGLNLIEVESINAPVHIAPLIFSGAWNSLAPWLGLLLYAAAATFLVLTVRRLTGELGSGLIMVAALILYLRHFSATGIDEYAMDIRGHLDYIMVIARQFRLPTTYECWSCYHPPLYYMLEAIVVRAVNILHSFDIYSSLRVFSLVSFSGFLIFSALILRRFVTHKIAYYSALTLLAFYPSGVFSASRLDSHLLFHTLAVGCFYFIVRWLDTAQLKHLALALVFLGLSIATRNNAYILLPLLGMAGMFQIWRNKIEWKRLFKSGIIWASIAVVLAGAAGNYGRTFYYRITENRQEPILVSNIRGIPYHYFGINNSPETVLVLNFRNFLDSTFSTPFWRRDEGRNYFWNVMLKTSLFGEFAWPDVANARTLSFLLIALLLYWANSIIICWHSIKRSWEWWALLAAIVVPVLFLMGLRLLYPVYPSQDFRYIYFMLCGFCTSIGYFMQLHFTQKRAWLGWLGAILCVFFVYKTVMFFL